MKGNIGITGGTGFIGQALIQVLQNSGYDAFAIRRPYHAGALSGVTAIINLAGENLSAGRWTPERKKAILESRVNTLAALKRLLEQEPNKVNILISASAIGYYGSVTGNRVYSETDPAGNDFLAGVCREWEAAADSFEPLGIRVAKVRIGVVLSEKGGALPKMMMPLKFGISIPLGTGNQWLSWIHMDDLVRVFLHILEHPELSGPFNAVTPNPVTNREFMKLLALRKHRLFIPIGVPSFVLKAVLGEMAVVTLEGSRVSAEKLTASGFEFTHPEF